MKRVGLNRILALLLIGVMTMCLFTACGDNEEGDTKTTPTPTTAAGGASTVAGIDGWTAFAEKVSIDIPVYDRGVEGVPDVSSNYWTKWIQTNFGDKYNIEVNFVPITRSDVLTSYSLLAISDDLPTILMEYDYPKHAQWASEGYLAEYDINEFAKVAPTYYNRMVELDQIKFTELDGKCYFVLAERPYSNTNYTFVTWYREDWLNQIGYDSYPTTWTEEKEMLLKLQSEGISEHPLGGVMVTGAGVDQTYGYRTYPQTELDWAMYGDYAIPALSSDANHKLLERINYQYNAGLLDPEYYLIDTETDKANFINGKTVQYSGYISADMDWLKSFYETNPNANLAVKVTKGLAVDSVDGTSNAFRPNNPFGMMIGFSSQASSDQIKAAWMYMEWMTIEENLFKMQWGVEGENYTMGTDGFPVSVADYSGECKQGYNNSKDYWCVTVEARNSGTIEDVIRMSAPKGLPEDFTQDIIDNYYGQLAVWQAGYANNDCLFAADMPAVAEYQASLLSLYTEYRDKLTMCKTSEFEALYEDLSNKYLAAGYKAIIDERKEAYEAGLSSKLK